MMNSTAYRYCERYSEGAIFSKKMGGRSTSPLAGQVPVGEPLGTRSGARFFTTLQSVKNDAILFRERLKTILLKSIFRYATIIATAILIISNALPSRASGEQLQWNLSAGDQFTTEFDQHSTTTTTIDKRTTQTESATTITMDWSVQAENGDGNTVIEQTITAIRMSIGNPAVPSQAIEFDSVGKDKSISKNSKKILRQIEPLIGLKYTVTMSPQGEIVGVVIPTEAAKKIALLPKSLSIQSLFDETNANANLQQPILLPDNPVEQNDSWEAAAEVINQFGAFNQVRTLTWTKRETVDQSELAEIEVTTTFQPQPNSSPDSAAAGTVILFAENGKLNFNLGGGFVASSELHSTTKTSTPYRDSTIETMVDATNRMTVTPR